MTDHGRQYFGAILSENGLWMELRRREPTAANRMHLIRARVAAYLDPAKVVDVERIALAEGREGVVKAHGAARAKEINLLLDALIRCGAWSNRQTELKTENLMAQTDRREGMTRGEQ